MTFNLFFIRITVLVFAAILVLMIGYNGLRIIHLHKPSISNSSLQVDIPDLASKKTLGTINRIPAWHLFKTSSVTQVAARETRLNLRLMGILSSSLDGQARVIIEHPSREQKYYKRGDEILPDVVLDTIYADHVVINNHDSIESLPLIIQKNKKILLKSSY